MNEDRAGLPEKISLLIFEESMGMARTLGELLQGYGFRIAGMATCRRSAEKLAADDRFDVALVTMGRNSEDALALADQVIRNRRKLVFLTGYGEVEQLPDRLRGYPCLDKPADPHLLVTSILGVLGYAWGS
jgi:DNA-binding NtrC family response regulator